VFVNVREANLVVPIEVDPLYGSPLVYRLSVKRVKRKGEEWRVYDMITISPLYSTVRRVMGGHNDVCFAIVEALDVLSVLFTKLYQRCNIPLDSAKLFNFSAVELDYDYNGIHYVNPTVSGYIMVKTMPISEARTDKNVQKLVTAYIERANKEG
jgi:hypothetical protein